MRVKSPRVLVFAGALVAAAFVLAAPSGAAERNAYVVTNLVSNSATVPAAAHDPSLVNAWGLTASSTSPWWVADNGADVSTLYNGSTGAKVSLTVVVEGGPTGTVFNIAGGTTFPVPGGQSSRFLFASEDGQIRGWPGSGPAQVTAARSTVSGAIYKGLAIANTAGFHFGFIEQAGTSLYATMSQRVTSPEVLKITLSIGGSEIMHFQTWHDKAGNAVPLTDGDLIFPDLQDNHDETLQANLIMPEPCEFISKKLPRCAIIRPTGPGQIDARGAINGFIADGLFNGQTKEFVQLVLGMAAEADEARRER